MTTPTPDPPPELYTLREAGRRFKVDPKTVRRWMAAGAFTTVRTPGGQIRLLATEVDDAVAGRKWAGRPWPDTTESATPEGGR